MHRKRGLMYLHLFHGRTDPQQYMDNWGEDGPLLIIDGFHVTYMSTIRVHIPGQDEWTELDFMDGMLYYDSMWYGDWSILTPESDCNLGAPVDAVEERFRMPPSLGAPSLDSVQQKIVDTAAAVRATLPAPPASPFPCVVMDDDVFTQYPDNTHASREELLRMVEHLSDVVERISMEAEDALDDEFKVMADRWSMYGRAMIGDAPPGFNLVEYDAQLDEPVEEEEDSEDDA